MLPILHVALEVYTEFGIWSSKDKLRNLTFPRIYIQFYFLNIALNTGSMLSIQLLFFRS